MREFYFGPNRTHFVLICRFAWFSLPSTSSSTNYSSVLFDSAVAASPSSSSSQLFFFAPVRCAFISDTQLLLAPPSKWAPLSSWWVQQKRARAAGGHLSARLPQWWIDRGVRTEQPTALSVTCKKKKKKKKSSLPYVYGERHRLETGQKLEATRHSSM